VDFPWVPSVELGGRLAALPARQRKAVLRIVQAEAAGARKGGAA